MYLHSVSAYVDKIVDELDEKSQQKLRSMTQNELGTLHHSWGMAIRNQFGLWEPDHPLTKHWHKNEAERNVRNDVDYSEDHPDAISMKIMTGVWRKVNA